MLIYSHTFDLMRFLGCSVESSDYYYMELPKCRRDVNQLVKTVIDDLSSGHWVNLSGAENAIFQENQVNTTAVGYLAAYVARSSTTMELKMLNSQVPGSMKKFFN